jgi:hypothetical protein
MVATNASIAGFDPPAEITANWIWGSGGKPSRDATGASPGGISRAE